MTLSWLRIVLLEKLLSVAAMADVVEYVFVS